VVNLLENIVDRGTPVMANRVHATVRTFFRWCIDQGKLERSPVERVKAPGHEESRDRVLTNAELVAVWRAADQIGYPYGRVVQLLILTAQRRREVSAMRWAELDLDRTVWSLPKERSKNKRAHQVALSEAVVEILRSLPRVNGGEWLFSLNGTKPTNNFGKSKARLDALSSVAG
jgi:integrase